MFKGLLILLIYKMQENKTFPTALTNIQTLRRCHIVFLRHKKLENGIKVLLYFQKRGWKKFDIIKMYQNKKRGKQLRSLIYKVPGK